MHTFAVKACLFLLFVVVVVVVVVVVYTLSAYGFFLNKENIYLNSLKNLCQQCVIS